MGKQTKKVRESERERGKDAHVYTVMFTKYQWSLHERKTERQACDVQKISSVCVKASRDSVRRKPTVRLFASICQCVH